MQEYVLGFMFSPDLKQVVLIEKRRPAWQAGFLNGVGGKVELHEFLEESMVREFREETGVITDTSDWKLRGVLGRMGEYNVNVFSCVSSKCYEVTTTTDEYINLSYIMNLKDERLLHNIKWLLAILIDDCKFFRVNY